MIEQLLSRIQSDLIEAQKRMQKSVKLSAGKRLTGGIHWELQTSLHSLTLEKDNADECQMTEKEWGEQQHTREVEIAAVEGTITVLDADDAHETSVRPSAIERLAKWRCGRVATRGCDNGLSESRYCLACRRTSTKKNLWLHLWSRLP